MNPTHPMRIGLAGLLGWVVPAGVLVGALGAYPTWALGGGQGLRAQLAAGAIVVGVMCAGGAFVARAARRGPRAAAFGFVRTGLIMAAGSLVMAAASSAAMKLPLAGTLLWTGVFYFAMLIAKSVWLARALRRDARPPAARFTAPAGRDYAEMT